LYGERSERETRRSEKRMKNIRAAFNPLKGRKRKANHRATMKGHIFSRKPSLEFLTFDCSIFTVS
jgi:hypothetical protein